MSVSRLQTPELTLEEFVNKAVHYLIKLLAVCVNTGCCKLFLTLCMFRGNQESAVSINIGVTSEF